jgi:iron complex outermembrane receptor protein
VVNNNSRGITCLRGLTVSFAVSSVLMVADSSAQALPDDSVLAEVTVTAQKRAQNMQDVGTAITAFDGEKLGRYGLHDVTDIALQVPGLQFNQYSATITVYNLRGVSQNDFSDHQEAPVAVYVDDAYVASMGALAGSMFDLERVEVLRGPQGTLFGRNATGGLIHYISRRPTDTPEGYLQVSGGNFGAIQTEGALGGPLADSLATRFSFATDRHDGYITNRIGRDINDRKQYAARWQFAFKPADRGEVLLSLHGLRNDHEVSGNYSWAASTPNADGLGELIGPNDLPPTASCPGCDTGGYRNPSGDVFSQAEDREGIFNRTVYGATGHVTWDFEQFTFTSVTDYLHLKKRYGEDSDVSPNPIFNYDTFQRYHQFSQELRLNGEAGSFRWIAGLYYLDYDTKNLAVVSLDPAFGGISSADFSLSTRSGSAFVQGEWAFLPRWTAILGLRYTEDDKRIDYLYASQNLHYDAPAFPDAKHTFDNVSGKAELNFKPTDRTLLYASINRGAKGGGWSAPTAGVIDPDTLPYRQETLTNYEGGFKSTFLDGAARLNAAAFYYDYRNYQAFFLQGLTQVVANRDAKVKGGEIEFAIVPARGFNVEIGISGLTSTIFDVPMPAGTGDRERLMPQAPKWSVNAAARYEWRALDGVLSIGIDAKWDDDQYFTMLNAPVDFEPAHTIANARVGYATADNRWEVAAFVRNLADRRYRVYNLDLSPLGLNQSVYAPPRLWGATLAYRWGK